jgi:Peptidase family M28
MEIVDGLAEGIGGRRPTGPGEAAAGKLLAGWLREAGLEPELEPFVGYSTFAAPFAVVVGLAIAPALLPVRFRRSRVGLAAASIAALVAEGSLRRPFVSRFLSRRPSANVVATIDAAGRAERTLCLMAHMDTSRSGLMFHPRAVGWMTRWIASCSAAVLGSGALEPLAGRSRSARRLASALRLWLLAGVGLLAERELRGEDVPGANDNASGCAVVCSLAARIAADPLGSTRVVVVLTGCEEAGTLGSQAFLGSHATEGWLFLNVDNVGGSGSVRFLRREGVIAKWDADAGLISAAASAARRRPELRMAPEDDPAGLTYDSSPVHASGGRALTLSVQDGFIPDLHLPTDIVANVDPDGIGRTLEAAAEIVAAVDRGEAS